MGTPEFAVPTLKKLIGAVEHQVVAVFTQAPKFKGRGLKAIASPMHDVALQYNIPVYTPVTLRNQEALDLINFIAADVIIVTAYGFLIPSAILSAKKYGCINIHPSSLPRHRGAAPLQRTIIEGDLTTSVCIMQMDEGCDTGDIILEYRWELPARIPLQTLHDQAASIGANLLLTVLDNIDTLPRIPQAKEGMSYAHKLKKEEGKINWQESAYQIDCKVRGMNPWPGVYFQYNDKIIKVLEAENSNLDSKLPPGTVINDRLEVACGQGTLVIKKVQQQGRKILNVEEFLRGKKISALTLLD